MFEKVSLYIMKRTALINASEFLNMLSWGTPGIYVQNAIAYTTCIHIQKGPLQKVNKSYSTLGIKKKVRRSLQASKTVFKKFLKAH